MREANARAVRPASVVRVIVPEVTVPQVTVLEVTVRSAHILQAIGRPVTAPSANAARVTALKGIVRFVHVPLATVRSVNGAREIGRAARDRHGMAHSVIRANLVAGLKVGATVGIFQRRKRDLAIALPKLWRVQGFAHDAMRKRGFLKVA